MTLIKCPECQKEISDTVKNCPHCGYAYKNNNKNSKDNDKKNSEKRFIICAIIVVTILIIYTFTSYKPEEVKKPKSKEEIIEEKLESTLKIGANMYNEDLTYSSYRTTDFDEKSENEYDIKGKVYFNIIQSEKKWETEFTCKCSYYPSTENADCNCDYGDNAQIIL